MTSPNIDSWYGVITAQDTDLVAYYSFNANNATDDAGNGNNGTLVNSPTFGAGRIGNAINFDGTQKRVVVNNTNIPKGTSDFTYSWWTKWNATPLSSTASYFENGTW